MIDLCDLSDVKDGLEAVQSAVTIVAVVLGGIWAYFKFVSGRTFRSRLEPAVSGAIKQIDGAQVAVVRMAVKNVGLSRVPLSRNKTTLKVEASTAARYKADFYRADAELLGVINVLAEHDWVEPGECIVEEQLLALPADPLLGLVVKFRLVQNVSKAWWSSTAVEWNAVAVIVPEPVSREVPAKV